MSKKEEQIENENSNKNNQPKPDTNQPKPDTNQSNAEASNDSHPKQNKIRRRRQPTNQMSWAERILTKNHNYIKIMILFYIIFEAFIHPKLNDLFVVDHTKDVPNSYHYGEPIDIGLYVALDPEKRKTFRELKTVPNVNYSAGFIGTQVLNFNFTMNLTKKVLLNQTHPYLVVEALPSACQGSEGNVNGRPCFSLHAHMPIIRWSQKLPVIKYNLLKGRKSLQNQTADIHDLPWLPYYFQNMSFDIVAQSTVLNHQTMRGYRGHLYRYSEPVNLYIPAISYDHFWDLSEYRNFLNFSGTLPEDPSQYQKITIHATVYIRSEWLWKQKVEFDFSYKREGKYVLKLWEDFKRAFTSNPVLLYTTLIVSFLRIIFSFMAFEAEISWWKRKSEYSGVSIRSLFVTLITSIISFLYICDEDTSFIVRAMHGISLLIQAWKIWKLFEPIMEFPYFKVKAGYSQSETAQADSVGFRYLSWVAIPAIIIFAIYHLFTNEYKSLYSFIIQVAAGASYAFGFLAMLPQVYINYKLKSVAGMSGAALVYKTINTFIDDMFAFVMKMPLMYRISCFRDDVVFFIWLYQRHIYPTDKRRINEFGEFMDNDEEEEEINHDKKD